MANPNQSGRAMVKYPSSKSDPICKWRNASVATTIELVSWLPKKRMSKESFRDFMRRTREGDFFHTEYQLALQLGLYYEGEDGFIPRFDHDITEDEARAYLHEWIKRYYVPNPFTKRGFIGVVPSINLLYSLVEYLEENPNKPNLATAGAALFGGEMGNIGCVKFILNEYSNIISVDKNNDMKLLLNQRGRTYVNYNRDDKKAFFEHFNNV